MTSTDLSTSQVMNFSSKDADELQGEIEIFTKKIEHEKINLRLCDERYQKQIETYNVMCGKPNPKSKENQRKEKDKNKSDKPQSKNNENQDFKDQKIDLSLSNNQTDNERLTNDINNLMLENKELRKKIEDLRKEKVAVSNLLEGLKGQRDSFKNKFEELLKCNEEASKKIKENDIERVKRDGYDRRIDFEDHRDGLEEKFHEIIEENIRRSRELKKESVKKRLLYTHKQDDEQAKLLAEEDISDRTPVLDVLIEKWKFFNKYKRHMLEKYIKNSSAIRDAFENMRKYLGIDEYRELPVVLEKMEEQMSSIEMFISKITNDLDLLEEKKRTIEFKIQALTIKNNKNTQSKNAFVQSKKSHISKLKNHIKELKEDIERKRIFFTKLQPCTEEFLGNLQNTYVSEYIPEKIAINKEVAFSESNIVEILANVEDYNKLYEEFQANNLGYFDKKSDLMINKDIEKLKSEMRAKLDQFRKDGLGSNLQTNFKGDNKTPANFDETIKKMADEIVKVVNSQNVGRNIDGKKKK